MKGERYSIEFIADQRRCDIYLIYITIMDLYEKNKEKFSFQIKNMTTFKENNFTTLQIDFEEALGDPKKSRIWQLILIFEPLLFLELFAKGTLYITGDMVTDRPSVRVILEKTNEFSNLDIKAFLGAYFEANKPNDPNLKNKLQEISEASNFNSNLSNIGGKNSPSRQELIKKLEEFGVTIFLPEGKKNNLDWVKKVWIYWLFKLI
jgi:hypothetical protein